MLIIVLHYYIILSYIITFKLELSSTTEISLILLTLKNCKSIMQKVRLCFILVYWSTSNFTLCHFKRLLEFYNYRRPQVNLFFLDHLPRTDKWPVIIKSLRISLKDILGSFFYLSIVLEFYIIIRVSIFYLSNHFPSQYFSLSLYNYS